MPSASPELEGTHPVAVPSAQKPWEDTAASSCALLQSPQASSIHLRTIQAAIQQV